MPTTTHSRKPTIEKMRQVVRPHIATLSAVRPNQALTARQHESLEFLIENTHALLRVVDGYDDILEGYLIEAARGQALVELHRKYPNMPATVWNAFVASQTEYLEDQLEKK